MAAKSTHKKVPAKPRSRRKIAGVKKPPAESAPADTGELLDMDEAIKFLKTTRPTFYRWLRSGKVEGMKVGRQWRFERSELERFLKGKPPQIALRSDIGPLLSILKKRAQQTGSLIELDLPQQTELEQAVKQIIQMALTMDANSFQLAATLQKAGRKQIALLRFRIDGVFHSIAEFDGRLLPPIVDHLKRMANVDPRATSPQQGQFLVENTVRDVFLDVRVNFLPTHLGEAVSLRILPRHEMVPALSKLPFSEGDMAKLKKMLKNPTGLSIFTGPSGSGKTTSLYAALTHINRPELNIITVECPVEVAFPWMLQIPVGESEENSFASLLRQVFRYDPDVVMIGEIRDGESMSLAMRLAISGTSRMVLTQLHAPDAVSALLRTLDLGCEPYLIADALQVVVSQRLVRRLCPKCSKKVKLDKTAIGIARRVTEEANVSWTQLKKDFRKPVGCRECRQLGYRGRTMVAEVLEMSPSIAQLLRRQGSPDEIRTTAIAEGMVTMAADGIQKAAAGQTSLAEVIGVLGLQE